MLRTSKTQLSYSILLGFCAVLLLACGEDEATGPSVTNPNFAGTSPLQFLDRNFHFVGWVEDFESVSGTSGELRSTKFRSIEATVQVPDASFQGMAVNGIDLNPASYIAGKYTSIELELINSSDQEFEQLPFDGVSVHNWTSAETGEFPAFSHSITSLAPFEITAPAAGSAVRANMPLKVKWDGAPPQGLGFYMLTIHNQQSNQIVHSIVKNMNTFTISARDMAKFGSDDKLLITVKKYDFIERVIDGKRYYFGVEYSRQNEFASK